MLAGAPPILVTGPLYGVYSLSTLIIRKELRVEQGIGAAAHRFRPLAGRGW